MIATGLLLLGLAVIGTQVQASRTSLHTMRMRLSAMQLAESQLAMLDLGLIEWDSVDEEQEEDFGPRYPDFAWRLTINETATEGLNLLALEILHHPREDVDDDFEFDDAETVYTVYSMRPSAQKLDLTSGFGLSEEEAEKLSEKLSALSVDGLSIDSFDPSILARLDFEELIDVLPSLLDAFGLSLSDISAALPPEALDVIRDSGLLDGEGDGSGDRGGP